MTVYTLDAGNGLAARIARMLKDRLIFVEKKTFPDGETYVRVPEKPEGAAIIVHSLFFPQEKRLMELMLTIDALKGVGADTVLAVIPYMAYARQDKRFLEGEPISIKVVLKSLEAAGVDALLTVDLHKPSVLEEWLSIPSINVVPYREIAEYFRGKTFNPVILAPDKGALDRAGKVAEYIGADFDYIVKERDRVTGEVRALPKELDVKDRDVIIVDDIISTGGTMSLAAKHSLEHGARKVYAVCTHAVMVKGALDRLLFSGVEEVIATDTVPSPVSKITVAESVVEGVKRLFEELV
ncbi:MAG: ribose-phosphate diphosphokinase [Thermoprotei archaeon]|nr:MAG: ribose-phosphate diphosphokinase [Thermoprotei archaeon]